MGRIFDTYFISKKQTRGTTIRDTNLTSFLSNVRVMMDFRGAWQAEFENTIIFFKSKNSLDFTKSFNKFGEF